MSRPAPTAVGGLPSHSPTCAGCGEENPAGLALEVDATEHGVSAVHRFDHRQGQTTAAVGSGRPSAECAGQERSRCR
jgi:hypothetical protein